MTQTPAGWYADPDPSSAGPGRLRYWDGMQWTGHVSPEHPPVEYSQQAPQHGQYPASRPTATTPDGQPLAGWWRRVVAIILDGFIQVPLYILAAIPVLATQWDELTSWFDDLVNSINNNTPEPPTPSLFEPNDLSSFALSMSLLGASLLYSAVFFRWKQATPGKLIMGLRVRRRDVAGPMPWSTILIRVGAVAAFSVLSNIPYVGFPFVILAVLNYLWPLWDDKKQTLHDKVAGTNVVKA